MRLLWLDLFIYISSPQWETNAAVHKCSDRLMRSKSSILWCGVQSVNNMETWWICCDTAISGLVKPQRWHGSVDGCSCRASLNLSGWLYLCTLSELHSPTQLLTVAGHTRKKGDRGGWELSSRKWSLSACACMKECMWVRACPKCCSGMMSSL